MVLMSQVARETSSVPSTTPGVLTHFVFLFMHLAFHFTVCFARWSLVQEQKQTTILKS